MNTSARHTGKHGNDELFGGTGKAGAVGDEQTVRSAGSALQATREPAMGGASHGVPASCIGDGAAPQTRSPDLNRHFRFGDTPIRVLTIDGEPWFVASDIAGILGYRNAPDMVRMLSEDERGKQIVRTPGGDQEAIVINESGLYGCVLRSRRPEAQAFRRWVTSEVLPAIRRTGSYGVDPMAALADPTALRGLLLTYSERVLQLEQCVEAAAPKVAALDRIASADGAVCITQAAKVLQMRPKDLFAWMREHTWIYRRVGGSGWVAYQPRLQQGVLVHKVATVERGDGTERVCEQVLVTPKGLARLAELIRDRAA